MKHLSKMKLHQLVKEDLLKREMNDIRGGGECCLCGCRYANQGGSSTFGNSDANNAGGLISPGGGGGSGAFY